MKTNKITRYLLGMVLAWSLSCPVVASADARSLEGLSVEVYPNSQEYALGELVKLKIRITNRSQGVVVLERAPSIANGDIRVFIAGAEGFREYLGPRWGLEDVGTTKRVELAPGEFREVDASILYHHRTETDHLSELYAAQYARQYINTAYAFVSPGTFKVKAVLGVGESARVESEPVQIRIHEPQGAGLQVWNVLKADADLGFFLQAGSPNGDPRSAKSAKQAEILNSLAILYPESRQKEDILLSVDSYSRTLQKLKKLNAVD